MSPAPPTEIADAHCEAFDARYVRLVVTAADGRWLDAAVGALCGYGTSVIGCDAEVAVERRLAPDETEDNRPGAAVLAFGFRAKKLGRAVANRVGQTLLTCPTVAVFDGLPNEPDRAPLGDFLHYFGDGYERREGGAWVVPLMEGEVAFPASVGVGRGVAGGVLLLCGRDRAEALAAARRAADAVSDLPGAITPFPGGVCRSGSRVGSRYPKLVASTNAAYCPTLSDAVDTKLPDGVTCVYELVVDGVDEAAVRAALQAALRAASAGGLLAITAPDFGGQLGRIRIALADLVA